MKVGGLEGVGEEESRGAVGGGQAQVPVEVAEHDELQVIEIRYWEKVLGENVKLCAPENQRKTSTKYPVPPWYKAIPLLHLAGHQQCCQAHQVQLWVLQVLLMLTCNDENISEELAWISWPSMKRSIMPTAR